MGQKDKKAKAAEQKARVAAKQNKKAAKKEKKGKGKGAPDSDGDDEDLETVLEQYAKQQALFLKVTETVCEPPSPRSSATLIGSPSNSKELFLFGGEYFNGALATFNNELFIYHVDRDEWRLVTSPNSPLPRSGHAWCRGGNSGSIYLFGGEFSSPKQGTFYHYNDFWSLDPSTKEWTRIESKSKSPPARSGHRMTYYKNFIILFGGFQDTSQQTKYLQDLWIYDCQNFVWHNIILPQKPDARSSFSFLPHDNGAVLYGGYSRAKSVALGAGKAKNAKGPSKTSMRPVIHQDTWFLQFSPPLQDVRAGAPPAVRWERRKRPVNAPNPPRAGATQAFHKGRGILFGGVHDVEESEEGMESEFFNTLFVWNIDRNRFFPLSIRRTKMPAKRQGEDRDKRGRAKAAEAELLRNLAALETSGSIKEADKMELDTAEDEEDSPPKPTKPVLTTMPHPRFNAQLAVQGDTLYIFGGTYEQGDREFTFADLHCLDIGKLDGVQEIYRRELENWQEEAESESDSDEEDDSEDEDLDGEAGASGVTLPVSDSSAKIDEHSREPDSGTQDDQEPEPEADEASAVLDTRPHPRPFESLRQFFVRTSQTWQELTMESNLSHSASMSDPNNQSVKEIRKAAFESAERCWWDFREEITAEEERQEEAGIGEVVNLTDRDRDRAAAAASDEGGTAGGAANRRR